MISGAYALVWMGCDKCKASTRLELNTRPPTIALFENLSPDYVVEQAAEKSWYLTEDGAALCPEHKP